MEAKEDRNIWKGIYKRQKKTFLASFLVVLVIFIGVALYLPPVYRAEATIMVENQEIPEEFVKSTVTAYVNERLQMITQQVLNQAKLTEIIEEYSLYPEIETLEGKIRRMRKDIELTNIDENIVDKRSARSIRVTVAFTLAYMGKDPEKVQQVADILAKLYVEEDIRSREKTSGTTIDFFENEIQNLRDEIKTYEEKISKFKSENINQLPGSAAANIQTIARLEQEIDRINTTIRTLKEKMIYLEGQITTVDPLLPVVSDEGKLTGNPKERLKFLQLKLIRLQANMSDKHPDIRALKSEIAELESQVGATDASAEKIKRFKQINNEINELMGTVGENHPDVIKLKREAKILSQEIERLQTGKKLRTASEAKPDNPAYMNLKAQIIAAKTEIDGLYSERSKKEADLEMYRKRLEMSPVVEREYNQLTRDFESAKQKYNDLLDKLLSVKLSREMDSSGRGEQFVITDPPMLPGRPYKPNRVAIILLGMVLGLGLSTGLVTLRERLDTSVKTADDVEKITGLPVIASVTIYESDDQRKARRKKRIVWASTAAILILCGSFFVDRYLVQLDDLWNLFEGRLVEMGIPIDRTSADKSSQ